MLFFQLNPEHTVPTLIDNGVVIWDSHAIAGYLVDKYAKTDDLYPKDLYLRAKCNQRMLFNASTLFVRIRDLCRDVFARGCTERCPDKLSQIADGYDILEAFLATDPFLVGLQLTIADICVAVTVLLLEIHLPLHADKHSKIVEWIKRVNRTIPFFNKMNMQPVAEFRELIESSYQKNKESQ